MKKESKILELILSILSDKLDKKDLEILNDSGWNDFSESIRQRNLTPLILYHLKKKDAINCLPINLQKDLEFIYYTTAKQNISAFRELTEVLRLTNGAGIGVIVLKGLSLANTVYPNIALRPMFDIDILIRKKHLDFLKTILLEQLGYEIYDLDFAKNHERFGNETTFIKKERFPFEVRWQLNQLERFKDVFKIDEDRIWNEAQTADIDDVDTLFLSWEDMLFYLCYHLSLVHYFLGIIWLYDIKALIEYCNDKFNWDRFLKIIYEAKAKTFVYQTLVFSKNLFNAPVPENIIEELNPSKGRKKLLSRLIDEREVIALPDFNKINENKYYIIQILLVDKIKDMVKVLFKIILPSRDWLKCHYSIESPGGIWLYCLIHPFIIFFKALRLLINASTRFCRNAALRWLKYFFNRTHH